MKRFHLSRMLLSALGAAALWTFMSPASAIVLTFTELGESGIKVTEVGALDINGVPIPGALTVLGESVSLFDRNQPGAVGNFTGLGSATRHVFNVLEPIGELNESGGTISDQIIVNVACTGQGNPPCDLQVGFGGARIVFLSDPAPFDLVTVPDSVTIESDARQLVGSFIDNHGDQVQIFLDAPEPATVALLGLGIAGLGFARRKLGK